MDEQYHAAVLKFSGLPEGRFETVCELLLPGSHVALICDESSWVTASLQARKLGLEPRDTLMVLSADGDAPVMLLRKPIAEPTVTKQVLKTGTGALNIDATRVKHASASDFERHRAGVEAIKSKGGSMANSWKNSSDLSGANDVTPAGRWPANVMLMHRDGCQKVGTKQVAAPVINRFTDGAKPFGNGAGHPYESIQTGDQDGNETIPTWQCEDGCPVPAVDRSCDDPEGVSRFFRHLTSWDDALEYLAALVTPANGRLMIA